MMSFDAGTFLEGLFDGGKHRERVLLAPLSPSDLPPEWHEEWDERAAIMEYDGGMPRERAEALALADIHKRMTQAKRGAS